MNGNVTQYFEIIYIYILHLHFVIELKESFISIWFEIRMRNLFHEDFNFYIK